MSARGCARCRRRPRAGACAWCSRARGRSPPTTASKISTCWSANDGRGVLLLQAQPAGPVEVALGRRRPSSRRRAWPLSRSRPWWNASSRAKNSSRSMPGARCRSRLARSSATTSASSSAGTSSSAASSTASRRNCASRDPVRVDARDERADLREHLNQALLGQQDQALPHRRPAHAECGGQLVLRQRGARRQFQGQHLAAQRLVHDAAVGPLAGGSAMPRSASTQALKTSTPVLDELPDSVLVYQYCTPASARRRGA